jgi:hypothetical protein
MTQDKQTQTSSVAVRSVRFGARLNNSEIPEVNYLSSLLDSRRKHVFVGVDPGIRGGAVFLFWDTTTSEVEKVFGSALPTKTYFSKRKQRMDKTIDVLGFYELCYRQAEQAGQPLMTIAAIEQVHAFPGQGVSSSFTFGKETGMVEAVLHLLSDQVYHAHPTGWKRWIDLEGKKRSRSSSLADSMRLAERFLKEYTPSASIDIDLHHDGIVDALLILAYSLARLKVDNRIFKRSIKLSHNNCTNEE